LIDSWACPFVYPSGTGTGCGATFIEFFLERVNYISCLAEDDSITSLSPKLSTGAGIRLFCGKADCYVSTNDLSFQGLKNALEKGLSILGLNLPSPNAYIPEINLEMFRDYATVKNKDIWLNNCSSLREMGDILLTANVHLNQKASHVQSRRAAYFAIGKKF
jgi:TldD protein